MRKYLVVRETGDAEEMSVDIAGPGVYHHTHHHHHHRGGEEGYVPVSNPVVEAVHARLENPPATWSAYAGHPNSVMAIIDMEHQELAYAKASGDPVAIEKELVDLAAACICALNAL